MIETKHRKESTGKPESKSPQYINSMPGIGDGNRDFKFFSQGKNSIQVFSQRRKKEFTLGYKGNWEGIGTISDVTARTCFYNMKRQITTEMY